MEIGWPSIGSDRSLCQARIAKQEAMPPCHGPFCPAARVWQYLQALFFGGKMNLRNAVALVTGGSSGIGRAIAQSLAASGTRVAITGRDERRLAEAARELGAHPIRADVSVEDDVRRTYREMFEKFGDLDILVNNAGLGIFKNLVDFDRQEFEKVFATNVTGAMLMAREAARHFVNKQRGHIVNISSTAGVRGGPTGTAYFASKFALRGMTECWRAELRKHNIRVILINPSEVVTQFYPTAGLPQNVNETKLRGEDIALAVKAALEMDDRGFIPELSVFATNPKD
jgi:3-oxoacyl-[acyl-carrier protein] reductase